MQGFRFDFIQEHDHVGIEDVMLKLRKLSKTYKNFGKFFYKVWVDAFRNYTTIFISFFRKEAPNLHAAMPNSKTVSMNS